MIRWCKCFKLLLTLIGCMSILVFAYSSISGFLFYNKQDYFHVRLTDIIQNHKESGSLRHLNRSKPPFYLTAVILVRIYDNDKAKWTKVELRQWIDYMLYAGVERIYLYDHFKVKNESLRP